MGLAMTIVIGLSTLVALALGALYLFYKRKFTYWDTRNVPHTSPAIPYGDLGGVGTSRNMGQAFLDIYEKNRDKKVFGFWTWHRPSLMVNDPDIIKRVLVQDFSNFHDHGAYYNEKDDPLSAHLFAIGGTQWKNLRAKLSPTFTSGKMKLMFAIVAEIGEKLQQKLKTVAEKGTDFEVKDLIARYSTDVISSCAFGIETNSLDNPDAIFRKMGQKILAPTWTVLVKNMASFLLPDLAQLLKLTVTPKDVAEFFLRVLKETVTFRETNNIKRNDFLQLLIELKNKGFIDDVDKRETSKDPFTFEQAAAQAFIFFLGGFETSSSVLQFGLWEIARNQEVQGKLREEIEKSLKKTDGKITYEGVHELKYMGMVIDETLRKYPSAPFLNRECNKDYAVAGTDCVIEKGTSVYIPVFGLQMDSKYFPNPEKFEPERFSEEEKAKRNNYVYIPFGEGPRFCIGQRFAFMQMRVALVSILSKYRVELGKLSPKTIKIDPKSLVLAPEGGMHLYLSAIQFISPKK